MPNVGKKLKISKIKVYKFSAFFFLYLKGSLKMYNYLLIELIKKFQNQDMTAFTLIYDNYKRMIYYFSSKTRDEDTTQELTLFLLELLYEIDTSRFSADLSQSLNKYISVSLKNKYISISKEISKKVKEINQIYEKDISLAADFENNIFICEALNQLTLKQRLIIIYKYIYCFTDNEIAQKLNITRQSVNRLKNRALLILKSFYDFEKKE